MHGSTTGIFDFAKRTSTPISMEGRWSQGVVLKIEAEDFAENKRKLNGLKKARQEKNALIYHVELDPKGGFRIFIPSVLPQGTTLSNFRIEPIFESHGGTIDGEWIVFHTSQVPPVQKGDTITFHELIE
jgi:hypothetical protein